MFKKTLVAGLFALAALPSFAQTGTIKVAFIDPLSGPFAPVGANILKSWQYVGDIANREKWAGDAKFEFVGFDNKGSPQESLNVLKSVIDQGYRFITQGNGSGAALALAAAVQNHNDRNPGKEVVFLNYAAVDPDLTNSKCSFWHFRIDANSDMKMDALTTYMAKNDKIKKVYILGQDYAFGHQVRRAAREYLGKKRGDVQIVGDELHPIGQVKDFSPYVAKIKASGADTIITGNWGADLALFIKAAKESGLTANFYTYYAGTTGVPTQMGASGEGLVRAVSNWHPNTAGFPGASIVEGFKAAHKDDWYVLQTHEGVKLLAEAAKAAKSIDPVKIAFAMEGLKITSLAGEVQMRAEDHQLLQPLYIAVWSKVNGSDVKYDQENTGHGFKTMSRIEASSTTMPTTCKMVRPAKPV
jgi:branched-chain amino acid transport system substrate-binding protein